MELPVLYALEAIAFGALALVAHRFNVAPILVLVSDGMDNTGRQDFSELANMPVPIDTLGFHSDTDAAGLDLAVREPHAPARVMVHNEIQVDVPVTKTGGPATEATVFGPASGASTGKFQRSYCRNVVISISGRG